MANIKPFCGYRYNTEKIENPSAVMAPVYDSITDEQRIELYEMHPNNIVRIIKGMNYENDTEENNCYTRAAGYLEQWIKEDVLKRDNQPAIYMYEQVIDVNETSYSTKGFVTLLKLEDLNQDNGRGSIMLCEENASNTIEDRFSLIEAAQANISMINCMYIEQEKQLASIMNELSEETPDMEFMTTEGVCQKLWTITYEPTIEFITNCLKDKNVYIADGQNRYTAALDYKKYMEENNPHHTGEEPYNYIMALQMSSHEDGMLLLPIHRLIKCPKGFKEEFVVASLQDHFKVEKIIVDTGDEELVETMRKQIATPRKEVKIALYCGGDYFYRLTLTDINYLKQLFPDKSEAYRMLDVTVLNALILNEIMNIPNDVESDRVDYTTSARSGAEKVNDGEYGCMFLLNQVKSSQISEVASADEKMACHSIFIFPKPVTGVVLYKFED